MELTAPKPAQHTKMVIMRLISSRASPPFLLDTARAANAMPKAISAMMVKSPMAVVQTEFRAAVMLVMKSTMSILSEWWLFYLTGFQPAKSSSMQKSPQSKVSRLPADSGSGAGAVSGDRPGVGGEEKAAGSGSGSSSGPRGSV